MNNEDKERINKLPFEDAFNELQEIVKQLENNTNNLAKSIELYEIGIHLKKKCFKLLDEAEIKIKQLEEEEESQ